MHNAAGFLDSFVQDELKCRCLTEEDFGGPLDNEENDVPLYDMYNRGLTLCEQGLERNPLNLEGQRPGTTGLIPSMEQAVGMGASPRSKTLVLELEEPEEMEKMLSAKRRGLMR
jgi:hypothetical protein